jgi:hypothetical protein
MTDLLPKEYSVCLPKALIQGACARTKPFGLTISTTVPSPIAETLALMLLVATLACVVVRPGGWPEAVFAVPAAVLLLALIHRKIGLLGVRTGLASAKSAFL